MVLSLRKRRGVDRVRYGLRRRAKANRSMTCRKRIGDIKTGVESLLRDESGGCLLTGQVVSGMKAARARSGRPCGTWEPVAPMTRLVKVSGRDGERFEQVKLRGVE